MCGVSVALGGLSAFLGGKKLFSIARGIVELKSFGILPASANNYLVLRSKTQITTPVGMFQTSNTLPMKTKKSSVQRR